MIAPDRIWITNAPPGQPSTGAAVIYSEGVADCYVAMGWPVDGPYVLEAAVSPKCACNTTCGDVAEEDDNPVAVCKGLPR